MLLHRSAANLRII